MSQPVGSPLVSVVVPAYNAAEFISDSILSILKQTHTNIEVIIVNDGSTDNTLIELCKIKDSRVKVYTIQNCGQCAASNFGLEKCSGDYIKFLDADDIINPVHIEEMLKVSLENPRALILCKWARFHKDIDKSIIKGRPEWCSLPTKEWFVRALSGDSDMLPVWQWLIPRDVIINAGSWDERLGLGNDFDFSTRLILASDSIVFCDKAYVYYRTGLTTSMSNDTSLNTIMSILSAIHKSKGNFLKFYDDQEVREAFAKKYFSWLTSYYPYLNQEVVEEVEGIIYELGGNRLVLNWGWKLNCIKKIIGWKKARQLQHVFYRLRY